MGKEHFTLVLHNQDGTDIHILQFYQYIFHHDDKNLHSIHQHSFHTAFPEFHGDRSRQICSPNHDKFLHDDKGLMHSHQYSAHNLRLQQNNKVLFRVIYIVSIIFNIFKTIVSISYFCLS